LKQFVSSVANHSMLRSTLLNKAMASTAQRNARMKLQRVGAQDGRVVQRYVNAGPAERHSKSTLGRPNVAMASTARRNAPGKLVEIRSRLPAKSAAKSSSSYLPGSKLAKASIALGRVSTRLMARRWQARRIPTGEEVRSQGPVMSVASHFK